MIELIEANEDKAGQPSKAKRKRSERAKLAETPQYRALKPIERANALPRGYLLDVSKALKMRLAGSTNEEIAGALRVTESAIQAALAPFDFVQTQGEQISAYVSNELEILDYIRQLTAQALITQLSNPERAEKLDIMRLNALFGTIFDKMRLIRGQSTQNIAALSKLVYDAHAKRSGQSSDSDLDNPIESD